MKKLLLLFIAIITLPYGLFAQGLRDTKSDIIKQKGTNYTVHTTKDGSLHYIGYDNDNPLSYYYFQTNQNNAQCVAVRLIYPISDINPIIRMLNKDFVKLDELKWKDYAKEAKIVIEIMDEYFVAEFTLDKNE